MMLIKRYLLPSIMAFMLLSIICKPASAFVDSNSHWARLQIEHLYSRGFLSGYPDDTYRPDNKVSREEFVTIMIKAIHKESEAVQLSKGDSTFIDDANRWSKGYIELAHELNISQGDGQGHFFPEKSISREEAVTMLVNCLHAGDLQASGSEEISDYQQISQWAQASVVYAREKGLVSGYPDGSFRPQVNISRAELACLLEGLLAYQGDQHHFYGTLQSVNLKLKQIIIELNGAAQTFEMAANVRVYAQGGKEPLKDLNLPAKAYFDLDSDGKLAFILLSQEAAHGQVNILLTALPDYTALYETGQLETFENEQDVAASSNVLKNDPGSSLRNTLDAMKVWDFVQLTGASGIGQLIAVIDSGVDPGHPDLQYTKENYNKIVDFIDLTNEGKVELNQTVQELNGYIEVEGKQVEVETIKSVDGEYRYGYLTCNRLPLTPQIAYPGGKILLLVSKSRYYDRYDSLYIDLDGDGQINDEKVIKVFSELHQKISIKGSGDRVFNFVLTEMRRDGQYVKLGFDAEGHGTMVAGIVAANGNIAGVAPDAQILPIKVANSAGIASLENLKQALRTAAERGVKIAVVSMGQALISNTERQVLSEMAANLWQNYGMAVCVAAGNDGPGLGTVAGTSTLNNIISVGAYITPEMLQNDYGWTIKEPELWYFSSTGPGKDGQAAPLVVAPGSAISAYPMWMDYPYHLCEGSSFAAPHVAGAAALLMDAVSHQLYRSDPRAVWMALLGGAEPLAGYQAAEQGFGAINLIQSWKEIKNLQDDPLYYKLKEYSPEFGYGTGFYSRYLQAGKLSVTITNPNSAGTQLALGSLASWIIPGQMTLQLPANSERTIDISFDELNQPGLYSSFLLADNASTPGLDVAMLQTAVVPYDLPALPGKRMEDKNTLAAGKYKRYFLKVPEGSSKLDLSLIVGEQGRACLHIIAPDGSLEKSDYAGIGGNIANPQINLVYNNPMAGIWEVVVYSTVTLSSLSLESSSYTFTAALEKTSIDTVKIINKYLVSALPHVFKAGEKTYLSLHFFNANNKQAVDDVVSIKGRLYEVKNGLLQFEIVPEEETLNLEINCFQ